jgi:putative sigma-54 modulation protein
MDIKVKAVHFDADKKLVEFVNEKVNKLEQFFDNIVSGEVHLKLGSAAENENKIAEIKILVPGKELFAKKNSKSFEESTDMCIDALKKQVQKHKEKLK